RAEYRWISRPDGRGDGLTGSCLRDFAERTGMIGNRRTGKRDCPRKRRYRSPALGPALLTVYPASIIADARFHTVCVDFAREARSHLAELGRTLDPIEDVLFEPRDPARLGDVGGTLGSVRREASQLKRVLVPLARTLEDAEEDLQAWSHLSDHTQSLRLVTNALDDIAALAERSRSLQDELTTRLAEETNRRLYIVSVVTTLVMPATFITGFFGMNTGGLPWGGDGAVRGTLYAGLMCLAAVLGTLALLRWKRLL
ncbi:MAG: CorA family divalent cation transporter, partial [Rhodopila sp.]